MVIGPAGIRPRAATAESLNWKEGPTRVSARVRADLGKAACGPWRHTCDLDSALSQVA